ncbi:MAG: hypothetical protein NTY55_01165 [Flavobacteriia bacterium]|nr:hypothetical protein [Flavobacteriia bacterium]
MKNRTKIIVSTSVFIIALLSIRNCSCNRQKSTAKPEFSSNNYLLTDPPLPELDIPYQKFEIDPSQPNVLFSKMGTKINIPSNAFLDKDGNVIKDKVEVSFREFYNPLDFYVAGIPMNYNDNGVDKVLESGGMVELTAKSNKDELFVNPSSKIKVDIKSWTKSKDFNLYDLDKTTGKWIEKGKDSISVFNKNKVFPIVPPMPIIATENAFKIADDTKMFPEIEGYKDVLFEPINISKCNISDAQEMIVKPLKNGIFEVTSIIKYGSFRKENTCLCYLAFEAGKDYNEAMKTYQNKYAKILKERNLHINEEEKILRTLTINNFGFVNCDYPRSYPSGGEINPIYVDENGKPILLNNVVLVEKNTNALFRYSANVKYNPKNDNLLWGLTNDNKIAFIKNADFKSLKNSTSKQKVHMHIHNKKVTTYEDVANVLFH